MLSDQLEPVESSFPLLGNEERSQVKYEYVDEERIDRNLVCELCYAPFVQPVMHTTCDNIFCRACLAMLDKCPKCRGPLADLLTDKMPRPLLNQLNSLPVKCPTCALQHEREKLAFHIQECRKKPEGSDKKAPEESHNAREEELASPAGKKEGFSRSQKILLGAGAVAVVSAVALPLAVPALVGALGFGSGGIVAGSWAAGFMASYGGSVAAGSACAVMQSIGAAGLAAPGIAAAAAGGAVVGSAAGGAITAVATSTSENKTLADPRAGDDKAQERPRKQPHPPLPDGNALIASASNVYLFSARPLLEPADISLQLYANRVLLIVNVASESRLSSQLAGLQRLYQKYCAAGFVVLGFPCDQWSDERGSDLEMREIYLRRFGVTFPLFTKTIVNGAQAHPLFAYLKANAKGFFGMEMIPWNYTKFLVDAQGKVVRRYGPTDTPEEIEPQVRELCNSV